ncbi:MAG: transposase [Solirubrobacteraceae bacterium]
MIAQQALSWPEIRRLMTVPSSRKLVAYLGLDPRVKQSGEEPASSGRISKRGSASARWALVEAASGERIPRQGAHTKRSSNHSWTPLRWFSISVRWPSLSERRASTPGM